MKQSHARIGKVSFKGGPTIHRLPTQRYEDWRGLMIDQARKVAANFGPDEVAGFVVIAWAADSSHSVGWRLDENSLLGRTMLPSWLSDVVRRELIETGAWPAAWQ